ncbi:hypothetical protein [Peribacillus kribbensis]|uniref:hypothetical protein n=1 Tax=Peribacillus kribbensis TaxID=356658 RepID=UPI000409F636|nr:hypothetical protein [Peribacillus kribbensis]
MSYHKIEVRGYSLEVKFTNGVVHIKNGSQLQSLLAGDSHGSYKAAETIKDMYVRQTKKPLNISTMSLAIEILGHVYPGKIIEFINQIPLPNGIKRFLDTMLDRANIIDCGEREKDSNRWVWDSLAHVIPAR